MFDIFNDAVVASVSTAPTGTHLSFPGACGDFSLENLPLIKSHPFEYDLVTGYEYTVLRFGSEKQEDQNSSTYMLDVFFRRVPDSNDISLYSVEWGEVLSNANTVHEKQSEDLREKGRSMAMCGLMPDSTVEQDGALVLTATGHAAKCKVTVTLKVASASE
ncbi:hypothetical protein ANAPRD1_01196 [Anaplasma phagocytophilum]|uniref:hypothetical protein n=1 Tax=Anaplasma phagocytophilum TaxID=948 RepID=UPI0007DF139A|nr:hypothetical protein [Anaplasma phagocytophilum]SBO30676.1 hypothetical protein ANAPC2_00351 [Anaplasma phagocytophilum]SBO30900.1 hypothetical protein ANAPC3_00341 [Anaplasma phagocytophilum]SBO33247.1 hypothetical protein ANAPC4_01087 [Anaplasma phagocytophilum]SCV62374.1 hypothetical protein ANAPC5_00236 [Anaplasma phagocytophilum]SCV66191.1 hypothetical protein ANAPH1_00988 [Anaplasma phagocytophilum]